MPPSPKLRQAYYLGVDPGKGGGLALISGKLEVVELKLMPGNGSEFYRWMRYHLWNPGDLTITLEKVQSLGRQKPQSVFTFGMERGKCEALIDITRYVREDQGYGITQILTPRPQDWIKPLPITKVVNDFKTKTLWKRYLRSVAKELFPKAKIWGDKWWNEGRTDAVSDAMLLAYYGWLYNQKKETPNA